MKKTERISTAKATVDILEAGRYVNAAGQTQDLQSLLEACFGETQLLLPDDLDGVVRTVRRRAAPHSATTFEVRNETSLEGAARLAAGGHFERVGVLNFASAKNPGGGFLGGAHAQEESLARSSALYGSLERCREFYDFHRQGGSLLYSDRMIYSPRCPVFRNDDGELLSQPYLVDFITSPAPNAGAIRTNEPRSLSQIEEVLRVRSAKVLALAAAKGCDALILGAWGCGVFRNSPEMVAERFAAHLRPGATFHGHFKHVLFSVLDNDPRETTISPFRWQFPTGSDQ